MARVHMLIAVPSYRGSIKSKCAFSLIRLVEQLIARNISYQIRTIEMADVVLMRNLFASDLLARKDATHLLFVDDDMAFEPKAVLRAVDSKKLVIGCAYRQRQDKIVFNIRPIKETADIKDGMCRVAAIGMGLTLIAREALERLVATGKLRKETRSEFDFPPPNQPIYGSVSV